MTESTTRVLLALTGEERDVFVSAANDLDLEVIAATDRASAVSLTDRYRPAVAVLDLSPTNGTGGGALAQVLRQTAPTLCPVFVGNDSDRGFIEAMMAGDLFVPRPVTKELATFALRTLVTKHALAETGHRRSRRRKLDHAESEAMERMARRLAGARMPGDVGEILKGFLSEVLAFSLFVFCPAPVEATLTPRVYVRETVGETWYRKAMDVATHTALEVFDLVPGSEVKSQLYGALDPADADGDRLAEETHWVLSSQDGEPVGLVMLLNDRPFQLSAPISSVCDELIGLAGLSLSRLVVARQEQMQLLHALAEGVSDGMIWIEPRRQFSVVNRVARRLLGMRETGSITRDAVQQKLQEVGLYEDFFGDEARSRELILKAAHLPGSDQHHRVELVRVRSRQGVVRGVFLLLRSLGADGREDRLLAEFSHDVRAPLNAIIGYSDVLRGGIDGPVNKEQRAQLRRIKEAARKIEGLIDYARANREAGREPVKRPVETQELLQSVADDFGPEARTRNIRIAIVVASSAEALYVDEGQMRLALSNLVANAMRFTPDGSTVRLEARRAVGSPSGRSTTTSVVGISTAEKETESERRVQRTTTRRLRRGYLELSCSDQGPGVSEDDKTKIFDRFAQGSNADTSASSTHTGSGLGLAITRDIVVAHRGKITVDNDADTGGAVFRILIPGGYDVETEIS